MSFIDSEKDKAYRDGLRKLCHKTMVPKNDCECCKKSQYEKDLIRRQEEHLRSVQGYQDSQWQPCMHDACQQCLGTGVKKDGSMCIHGIACSCPKCSPRC